MVILALPLLFYTLLFRSFPHLLGVFFTKHTINDFEGIVLLCAYYTLVSFLLVGYLLKQNGRAFFKVRFHSHCIGLVILLALANLILSATLLYYLPLPLNQAVLNESRIHSAEKLLLVRFYWGGIVALINEELFYRGVLMSTYFKNSHYHLDILASTICFASVHLTWSSWSWFDFIQYIPAGLSLGLTFKWTRSIYYPILLHFLVNYGPRIIAMILT
nr:type II CAAX endopeptidase family protein [Streptococcus gallolyticus]